MKLNRLFIGNIYKLNKITFEYGPYFAPLSLSRSTYDINFEKRTLLYRKSDYTFIDLCANNSKNFKSSDRISEVKENESFVMIDNKLIDFENELLKKGIKRKHVSKCLIKKMISKIK